MNSTIITERISKVSYIKLFFAIVIGWYFFDCALHTNFGHFIDNIDLIFHEAGHWIFIFFGQFVSLLGGSLNQILIPLIFCIYFFLKGEFYSASILSIWFGYNIVNVSFYMADAIKMNLPLLGGESSIHDWNAIFSMTNTLKYTDLFSSITWYLGIFIMSIAIIMSLKFAIKSESEEIILN